MKKLRKFIVKQPYAPHDKEGDTVREATYEEYCLQRTPLKGNDIEMWVHTINEDGAIWSYPLTYLKEITNSEEIIIDKEEYEI